MRNAFPLSLAAVVGVFFAVSAAQANIRRTPGAMQWGPEGVWTNNTTNDIFFPMSEPMPSNGMNTVRYIQEMGQSTGNCQIKAAMRYSGDGVGWDAPQALATAYVVTNTVDVGTGYVDIVTGKTQKPWVQFGVFARNIGAGSAFEMCNATLQLQSKLSP